MIFHKTLARLTFLYVGILMLLSLVFSGWLYAVAGREVKSVLVGANSVDSLTHDAIEYTPDDTGLIADSNQRLITDLIFFNLFVFGAGTLACYGLARRTLRPIHESYLAQEQFVADASHELKTPLTALKAELQIARRAKTLRPDEYRDVLESSLEEVNRLATLTERLLRLTNDAPVTEVTTSSVNEAIKAASSRMARPATVKDITIKRTIQPNLHVLINQDDFSELLVILLDNAIKYCPRGSSIDIHAVRRQKQIVITISDTGPGIATNHIKHIFKRFYRADQAHSSEGHGLGLAIANGIVRRVGGNMSVRNNVSHGAVFTIVLPYTSL